MCCQINHQMAWNTIEEHPDCQNPVHQGSIPPFLPTLPTENLVSSLEYEETSSLLEETMPISPPYLPANPQMTSYTPFNPGVTNNMVPAVWEFYAPAIARFERGIELFVLRQLENFGLPFVLSLHFSWSLA
ncbi:hypothetical protein TWF506_008161 [Arthrobotrys conoides]|uniref:Uncharacterized protein n=1 Tax=Arthrobotrys conoides TaxID=74498 RepID=A0AAN8RTN8_9PEZI